MSILKTIMSWFRGPEMTESQRNETWAAQEAFVAMKYLRDTGHSLICSRRTDDGTREFRVDEWYGRGFTCPIDAVFYYMRWESKKRSKEFMEAISSRRDIIHREANPPESSA